MPSQPATCAHEDSNTQQPCRMPVSPGSTHCGAHSPTSVPCPHCTTPLPSASLPRHLSKPRCPVLKHHQRISQSVYYSHNINQAHPVTVPPPVSPTLISVTALLNRLPRPKHLPALTTPPFLSEHAIIHHAWTDPRDHTLKMEPKHFTQIAALSSILLSDAPEMPTHVVELAAGRAYTSLYLAHVLNLRNHPTTVTTVDRGANRYKADRTLRTWCADQHHSLSSFQRIRVDLAHLCLERVPGLEHGDVRIVAKHACGAALDFALTLATNFARSHSGDVRLVLASCCRNRCAFHAFGDGARVWKQWGVSEEQLAEICKAAQWPFDDRRSWVMAKRGRECQALVDHARVEWLRSVGWDAYVTRYTEASPESACIVAHWNGRKGNTNAISCETNFT